MTHSRLNAPARAGLAAIALLLAACSEDPTDPDPGHGSADVELAAQLVTAGLDNPTHVAAPAGDDRLFIVEQAGVIRILLNGSLLERPFLDISDRVAAGGELGMFSIAFHPDFASNGWFYVDYTDTESGDIRVERYTVSAVDPDSAEASSAHLILHVPKTAERHNGGQLAFGPDGMLYISLGDDRLPNEARDPGSLMGKILRIDVDAGDPYAIPDDNPFVDASGARGEVWALGLRNPWRFSFDASAGYLYIADVGEQVWEEINVQPISVGEFDYGWNTMDGPDCYQPATGCDPTGITPPLHAYTHDDGCAVTGGFVYRGSAIPEIRGHYFYSDSCRVNLLRSLRLADGAAVDHILWDITGTGPVVSFGTDGDGELYMVSFPDEVHRIVRAG